MVFWSCQLHFNEYRKIRHHSSSITVRVISYLAPAKGRILQPQD
jgi:hypothetical protein